MTKGIPNPDDFKYLRPEEHRQTALELYKMLYNKTPKFEYKKRIEELNGLYPEN